MCNKQTSQSLVNDNFATGIKFYENGDMLNAIRCFKQSANEGNVLAQYNLGLIAEYGFIGPVSFKEAAKWYTMASTRNFSDAKTSLQRVIKKKKSTIYNLISGNTDDSIFDNFY